MSLAIGIVGWVMLIPMLWAPQIVPAILWAPAVVLLFFGSALNARGTYHVSEHVWDMAPGAIVVLTIAAIAGAVR